MELALFVYFAGMVEGVKHLFFVLSLSSIITVVFVFEFLYSERKDMTQFKKYIAIPVIFGFLAAITPSEKTMYMMLTGYTGQQALQSETASKIQKVIDAKLDEYLKELIVKEAK